MNQINIHIGQDFADEAEVKVSRETPAEPAPAEPKKLGHFQFNIPEGTRVTKFRVGE
jgi:hypothetical protein